MRTRVEWQALGVEGDRPFVGDAIGERILGDGHVSEDLGVCALADGTQDLRERAMRDER